MKLYKTVYLFDDENEGGIRIHWTGTQKDAATVRRQINENPHCRLIATKEHDVPTVKAQLINWLNRYASMRAAALDPMTIKDYLDPNKEDKHDLG